MKIGDKMKTLDELIADKILEMVQLVLSRVIKPDIHISKLDQLNSEEIEKLKQKYGIEGIILDVDNTLRKDLQNIPKCNDDWIESLRGKIKIIVLSNGIDREIEEYFAKKGIDYIGFANKPLKKNFRKACKKMDLTPDKVLVIGNSLVCDIYGGKRNNMKTALVKDVEDNER